MPITTATTTEYEKREKRTRRRRELRALAAGKPARPADSSDSDTLEGGWPTRGRLGVLATTRGNFVNGTLMIELRGS